jgi:hypothetical protein
MESFKATDSTSENKRTTSILRRQRNMINMQQLFLLLTVIFLMALLCMERAESSMVDIRRDPLRQRAMQEDNSVPTAAPAIVEYWPDQVQLPTAAPVIIDYWPLYPPTSKPAVGEQNFLSRILSVLYSLC